MAKQNGYRDNSNDTTKLRDSFIGFNNGRYTVTAYEGKRKTHLYFVVQCNACGVRKSASIGQIRKNSVRCDCE